MKFYYRISDNSYHKIKIPGTSKKFCLENFLSTFSPKEEELEIIADNCSDKTLEWLSALCDANNHKIHKTSLGNAGALLYGINLIIDSDLPLKEVVYLVEDDYIHCPYRTSKTCLEDNSFLTSKLRYWTLFDHPDKYSKFYNHGEKCRVFKPNTTHWRTSISTTMTFFSTVETLTKDYDVWLSFLNGQKHPNDHKIFESLNNKSRELLVSIPGMACHTDLTFSGLSGKAEIDQWTLNYLFKTMYEKFLTVKDQIPSVRDFLKPLEISPNLHALAVLSETNKLFFGN